MAAIDPCARDRQLFGPGPKRILSLDGGGVRGIFALAFLERIESILQGRFGGDYRLSDHFHLIGGTSSGAIIATGLARGMVVGELIDIYLNLAQNGFVGSRWHGGIVVPRFATGPLLHEIKSQVGDDTLGSENVRTGLAIVAKRIDTGSVWIFHNNPRGRYFGAEAAAGDYTFNKDLPLAHLVRASTAAPTFFEPERIEIAPGVTGLFVDGGVSPHNNPALLLFMLATLSGYGISWPTGADRLSLVSVGTGFRPLQPADFRRAMLPIELAVRGLHSVMEDSSWLAQALLQWFGQCDAPWAIDGELGDLSGDQLGPGPLLKYARFDLELTHDWLNNKLRLDLSETDLRNLQSIDDPRYSPRMLDIGRQIAEHQIGGAFGAE